MMLYKRDLIWFFDHLPESCTLEEGIEFLKRYARICDDKSFLSIDMLMVDKKKEQK